MPKAKKLPSGSWRAQASKTINGTLIRKSFTSETKKQAEFMAAEWQLNFEENKSENISLKSAYTQYISAKENILSPSTIIGYKALLKNSFSDIMNIPITSLSQAQIQQSVNFYSANHSPKSVKNAVGLLVSVFSMFRPNFNLKLTTPQKTMGKMYIPNDDDIKATIEASRGTRLEIPILLAAFGPMRRGEICALTSDDIKGNIVAVNKSLVKTQNKEWVVKQPKTYSSYREIEYPDFVVDKLKDIKGRIVDVSPDVITKEFLRLLKKNGIPAYRFHDLRHYAVSTLHAINVPDKYIMARGGWATNYTMNNVYNHALKNKQDEYNNKISKHFENVYQ